MINDVKIDGGQLFQSKPFVLISLFIGIFIHTCTSDDVSVSVEPIFLVSLTDDQLFVGETIQVNFHYTNSFGIAQPRKTAQWSTSHPEVIQVDAEGNLKAISSGTATITVGIPGHQFSKTVTATVSNLASLSIISQISSIQASSSLQLVYRFNDVRGQPNTHQKVTWTSDDTNIIDINPSGEITALDLGSATLSVHTQYLGIDYIDTITLVVNPLEPTIKITNPIESITYQQEPYQLLHVFTNEIGHIDEEQLVSWKSQQPHLLVVDDESGKLKVMDNGTALISVSTLFKENSYLDVIPIIVHGVNYTASIQDAPITMLAGKTQLVRYLFTKNHTNENIEPQSITWSSNRKDILTVNPTSGMLQAIKEGDATIKLTLVYNGTTYSEETNILVEKAEDFQLHISHPSTEPLHVEKNNPDHRWTHTFIGNQKTELTNQIPIEWKSSDASIADFQDSKKNILELKKPGTVKVTAQTVYQGKVYPSNTIEVTIIRTPKIAIIHPPKDRKLLIQKEHQLRYIYVNKFDEMTPIEVVWASSEPSIVQIHPETGIIKGIKPGKASVSVTTKGGTTSDPIYVWVIQDPQIKITNNLDTMEVGDTETLRFEYTNENGNIVNTNNISVTWYSEDSSVLSIHEITGKIEAIAEGKTSITVKTNQGVRISKIIEVIDSSEDEKPSSGHPSDTTNSKDSALPADETNETTDEVDVQNPIDEKDSDKKKDDDQPPTNPQTQKPRFRITNDPKKLIIGTSYPLLFNYINEKGLVDNSVDIEWASTDRLKLSVSDRGLLEALSIGDVSITARVRGTRLKATITIAVVQESILHITNRPTHQKLKVGKTHDLDFALTNEYGKELPRNTGTTVKWRSDNQKVLTIDPHTGVTTANALGSGTITAKSSDVPTEAKIKITVIDNPSVNIIVPSELMEHKINVDTQSSGILLDFNAQDENGEELQGVTWEWSSGNSDYLDINKTSNDSGELTPKNAGVGQAVTITLQAFENGLPIEGYHDTVRIQVIQKPTLEIKNPPTNNMLKVSKTHDLDFVYTDEYGVAHTINTGTRVVWDSDDEDIVTFDENTGVITAEALGNVTITAASNDVPTEASVKITVVQTPFANIIVPSELTERKINVDTQSFGIQLDFEAQDEHGNSPQGINWKWSSSNSDYLDINKTSNDSGKLTPKKDGVGQTAIITLQAFNTQGEVEVYQAQVDIKIIQTSQLTISSTENRLKVDETGTLSYVYIDENGASHNNTGTMVIWSSDDEDVLTVDGNTQTMTAIASGTVLINAQVKDIKSNEIKITVEKTPPPLDLLIWKDQDKKTVIINPVYDGEKFIGETDELDGTDYVIVDDQLLRKLINQKDKTPKCTTLVTNMKNLFKNKSGIEEITHWDMSNVITTEGMFHSVADFNQEIGHWDVSSVTTMKSMFWFAFDFNQNLNNWVVSRVTDMNGCFVGAKSFNGEIGNWDVSNVTDMGLMFYTAKNFNQDIGGWDVSSVTNMEWMLSNNDNFNQDIGDWDVSSVTNMDHTFASASSFNQDIGEWNVSNVRNMKWMFHNTSSFNQDIGEWDVSNVRNMEWMFTRASVFNQDISMWDVRNVINMRAMFSEAISFNQDISVWKVLKVKNMQKMFFQASSFDHDLSEWNVDKVDYCLNFANSLTPDKHPNFSNCEVPTPGW